MVVDNCPTVQDLNNIQLIYLPPNTTCKTQPMDMGIIKNVKHKYRTSIAKKRLVAYETGKTFKFNLYQCLPCVKLL